MEALRDRLEKAWERSDLLFGLVNERSLLERPIPLRHPFLFYVGHLPAFAWNQVGAGVLGRPSLDAHFERLFARGIDPDADGPAPAGATPWPPLAAVLRFRDRVRDELRGAFDRVAERAPVDELARGGRIWHVVIEHELMHHETLLYMVQALDHRRKRMPAAAPPPPSGGGAVQKTVAVPAGPAWLGAAPGELAFGWDNEFPRHETSVAAFDIDALPVRNGDFLEFVEAGGYFRREHWLPADWQWICRTGRAQPPFWSRRGSRWMQRTLFEDVPLERAADWPVWASLAEARAYARWRGAALPSEAQLRRVADGAAPPAGNHGFRHWSPVPAGVLDGGGGAEVRDLVGNGWEWTRTVFAPLPGFRADIRTYPGYSADFFDGRHYVMLGASWATDEALVRPSFRNWFQPHYPWVWAKFRLVRE